MSSAGLWSVIAGVHHPIALERITQRRAITMYRKMTASSTNFSVLLLNESPLITEERS